MPLSLVEFDFLLNKERFVLAVPADDDSLRENVAVALAVAAASVAITVDPRLSADSSLSYSLDRALKSGDREWTDDAVCPGCDSTAVGATLLRNATGSGSSTTSASSSDSLLSGMMYDVLPVPVRSVFDSMLSCCNMVRVKIVG